MEQKEELVARAKGSATPWLVACHYFTQDGELRRTPEPPIPTDGDFSQHGLHAYFPLGHPEVVGALARLREGDEAGVVRFAQRWGVLGYDDLARLETDHPYRPREGEPLEWIWAHADNVRRVLHLLSLVKGPSDRPLADYLNSIAFFPKSYLQLEFVFAWGTGVHIIGPTGARFPLAATENDGLSPRVVAWELLEEVIHRHVRDARLYFSATASNGTVGCPERSVWVPSLLTAIYWHLSDAATGTTTFQQCHYERCQQWFRQEHGLQVYCPSDNPETESRCAVSARQGKHRRAQREARAKGEKEGDHGE